MRKIILLLLVTSLIVRIGITSEAGTGVVVEKTAPQEIVKGDILPVTISITNELSYRVKVIIKERFGGAEAVDMGDLKRNIPEEITSAPPYYEGVLTIDANSERDITYKIKPLYFGRFKIPATTVYTSIGTIRSNSLTVLVKCNQNGICETDEDENAITCPEDCSPRKRDDLCNPLSDGICDPDCKAGEDPDCGITTTLMTTTTEIPVKICGNKICEYPMENYGNCPQDCASGGGDGYCDKVEDGKCDPDCKIGEDPDCEKPADNLGLMALLLIIIILVIIIAYKKEWLKIGR